MDNIRAHFEYVRDLLAEYYFQLGCENDLEPSELTNEEMMVYGGCRILPQSEEKKEKDID